MPTKSQKWLASAARCRRLAAEHTDATARSLLLELAIDAERAAADAEIDAIRPLRPTAKLLPHQCEAGIWLNAALLDSFTPDYRAGSVWETGRDRLPRPH